MVGLAFLLFRPDGKKYVGQWREGKQDGFGTYIMPSGQARRGEWVLGKRLRWIDEIVSEQESMRTD